MIKTLSCPNCGAPITGNTCEYCGTVFDIPKTVAYVDNIRYELPGNKKCPVYAEGVTDNYIPEHAIGVTESNYKEELWKH